MRNMKKWLAAVLALVMVFAMAACAVADETPTTFTITAPDNGHTYEVYQIFTGDLSGKVLSNVKWGENGSGTKGEVVDDTILTELAGTTGNDTAKLAVISKYVDLDTKEYGTVTNIAPLTGVPAGYYLIKDVDGALNDQLDSYTLYIVQIVGDVAISPKSAVPTFEKKLKDTNDTTGVTSDWQDSADWDIGDEVPFQLKGTVASNYDNYKTYYFAFHDKEEKGLTFDPTSVVVKVDGVQIESGYVVKTSDKTHTDCTFEVIFADLKEISSVHANSVITVEYESLLNENANIGNQGNVNQAKLEFSNNPNEEQEGEEWTKPETGETPWDNVIVFTYKTVINKVDGSGNPLTGAAFKLEKQIDGGEGEDTWQSIKEFTINEESPATSFEFVGLDDGTYRLTETVTPAGYNTIDPITFTVTAEHANPWEGADRTTILTSLSGNATTGELTFTSSTKEGSLSAAVVNNAGSTLPETGGMGTTVLYVGGGVLVLAAVVLLIAKRRSNA